MEAPRLLVQRIWARHLFAGVRGEPIAKAARNRRNADRPHRVRDGFGIAAEDALEHDVVHILVIVSRLVGDDLLQKERVVQRFWLQVRCAVGQDFHPVHRVEKASWVDGQGLQKRREFLLPAPQFPQRRQIRPSPGAVGQRGVHDFSKRLVTAAKACAEGRPVPDHQSLEGDILHRAPNHLVIAAVNAPENDVVHLRVGVALESKGVFLHAFELPPHPQLDWRWRVDRAARGRSARFRERRACQHEELQRNEPPQPVWPMRRVENLHHHHHHPTRAAVMLTGREKPNQPPTSANRLGCSSLDVRLQSTHVLYRAQFVL